MVLELAGLDRLDRVGSEWTERRSLAAFMYARLAHGHPSAIHEIGLPE